MANMGYCRFYNTAQDLSDCLDHIYDDLEGDEETARKRLVHLCKEIIEATGDDGNEDEA